MELRPGLDKSPGPLGKRTGDKLNWLNREHRHVFLVIGMKVAGVMPLSGLEKHPNDDAKKSREFRHAKSLFSGKENLKTNAKG